MPNERRLPWYACWKIRQGEGVTRRGGTLLLLGLLILALTILISYAAGWFS